VDIEEVEHTNGTKIIICKKWKEEGLKHGGKKTKVNIDKDNN
jgi:hypothetical protein